MSTQTKFLQFRVSSNRVKQMISQTEICLKTEDGELIEAVFVESVIDITTHRSSKRELDRKCYLREKRSVNRSRVIEHVGGNKFLIDGKIRATAFPCVE